MTVSETMRIAGWASRSSVVAMSNGFTKSTIGPVTRTLVAWASCSTTVVSQSCSASFSRIEISASRTPAPTIAQSRSSPGIEEIVEIDRLMRPMKIADPDVDDAGAEIGAFVVRTADARRQSRQGGGGKFDGHLFMSTRRDVALRRGPAQRAAAVN